MKDGEKEVWRSDKSLQELNWDIDQFNYEFNKISRKVLRWIHKGFKNSTAITSTDGTHHY